MLGRGRAPAPMHVRDRGAFISAQLREMAPYVKPYHHELAITAGQRLRALVSTNYFAIA